MIASRAPVAPPDSAVATSAAPCISRSEPMLVAATSGTSTTSGSSSRISVSKSPPRAARRNASTTSRWRSPSSGVGGGRSLHPPPGPARELPRRLGRAFEDLADLVERHREHVVQHEGDPLGRTERVEHDQQRGSDRLGQQRVLGRIVAVVGLGRRRALDRLLGPGPARPQPVEAHPADDGRQQAADVLDAVVILAGQSQPGLLHRVVGVGVRAEHPVRDRVEARPARFELRGQPLVVPHAPMSYPLGGM